MNRGELLGGITQAPYLRLPEANVFADRAERFRTLSTQHHPLGDYLRFCAVVSRAQHDAYTRMPTPTPTSEATQARAREFAMPVLNARDGAPDDLWREVLSAILDGLRREPVPPATQAAMEELRARSDAELDGLARRLLASEMQAPADLAAAPLLGAALQVYWTRRLTALGSVDAIARLDTPGLCPACGSLPVASRVRIGPEQGLRYAVCGLCQAEWNVVRIKCVHCASTAGIAYYGIGERAAIKAEACDECGTYLKIMYMAQSHEVDPIADDVATLSLDLLMAEEGKARYGHNFFLQFGASQQQEQDAHHALM